MKIFLIAAACFPLFTPSLAQAEWVHCAGEGEFCQFSGRVEVRYGTGRNWTSRSARNGIRCSNENFGDPAPGRVKSCMIPASAAGGGDWDDDWNNNWGNQGGNWGGAGWQMCAREGEFCAFNGRAQVRYGTGNRFATRNARNGIHCGNETFGDPAPGRPKACFIQSDNSNNNGSSDFGWRHCAEENENCRFSGTREVRYGVGNRWATRTGTNGLFCGNIVFGDPAPDRPKSCFVRDR